MTSMRQGLSKLAHRYLSDTFYVRLVYYYSALRQRRIPELLSLRNPKTWNEKISYIKLNIDRLIPEAHFYADKLNVRDYVARTIGDEHLVPLLGSWSRAKDISWSVLPERFVLKANHGAGFNVIVRDRSELDLDQVTDQLNSWLETDYSHRSGEKQYQRIPRRLLAEELIAPEAADLPDYKFFCFDGRPKLLTLDLDRRGAHKRRLVLDMDWNPLPIKMTYPEPDKMVERPAAFELMASIAEALAAPFFFVRVDLYEDAGSIYFGELTFTQGGGLAAISPRSWNRKLGDLIRLPR